MASFCFGSGEKRDACQEVWTAARPATTPARANANPYVFPGLLPISAAAIDPRITAARADVNGHYAETLPALCPAPGPRSLRGDLGDAQLRALDVQVRLTHWRSDDERHGFVRAQLEAYLRIKTGKQPDPDELFVLEQAFEERNGAQQQDDARRACDRMDQREAYEIEAELMKERVRKLGGVDLREYPVLNMHAAMAGAVEPYLPVIQLVVDLLPGLGVLSALYEAIEGETLLTRQRLDGAERYIGIILAALPMVGGLAARAPKALALVVEEIVRRTGISARRAYRLIRGLGRVRPHDVAVLARVAQGARLTAEEARAGKAALRTLTGEELRLVAGGAGFTDAEIAEHLGTDTERASGWERQAHGDAAGVGADDMHLTDARGAGVTGYRRIPYRPYLQDTDVLHDLRALRGFRQYEKMLARHGISEKDVLEAIATVRAERPGEAVGSEAMHVLMKKRLAKRVMAPLLDPAMATEESCRRMRRMTAGLSPADKGELTEAWYHGRFQSGRAARQVKITEEEAARQGVFLGASERRIDSVVDGEATEIKSGAGKLKGRERGQLRDYLKMVDKQLPVTVRDQTQQLKRLTYVFTDPQGALNNLDIIATEMKRSKIDFRLTLFNRSGQMRIFDVDSISEAKSWLRR